MDIEPCWWCGSAAIALQSSYRGNDRHWVECYETRTCGSRGPDRITRAEAIAAWNRVADQRWRPIETAPEDRRGLIIHVKPGVGATHWRPALEPPEPAPIETSGYVEIIGKEPLP